MSWSPRASRRSRSATCSRSSIRRMSGGRARSSPSATRRSWFPCPREVDPAFREYERTCVTAFDAYIKPVVGRYLESMEQDLAADGVRNAAADHAVARRHQLLRHRPAASGAALPVGPRGRCDRRPGGRPRGRDRGPDHRRYRRDELRHRLDQPRAAAHPRRRRDQRLFGARADGRCERDRRGRRVDRVDRWRRLAAGRAALRGLGARPRLLRPRRRAGDGDRCVDRPGLHRSGLFRGRFAEALAGPRAPDDRDDDRRPARSQSRTCGARHPSRPQRADGGSDPARLDRPRHRSPRLHAPAAGRWRPPPCDRAGARTGHPTHRRAAASRRAVGDRPALCARSNTRVPRPFRGCSLASSGRKSNGPSPTATRPAPG